MRVLTYNLHGLRDDTAALVRVLRATAPDVVCVQEAPRLRPSRLVRLARAAQLEVVARNLRVGLALLAAAGHTVKYRESSMLSRFIGLQRRGLCAAVLDNGPTVASVHLDLSSGARLRHVAEVTRHMERLGGPVILGGDFNEQPGATAWRLLTRCYRDAGGGPTFTARHPRRRIDAIFTSPSLEVIACDVPGADPADLSAASDHLPVLAELRPMLDDGAVAGA